MPFMASRSLLSLSSCSWNLQKIIQRAITITDFSVIEGHRDKVAQELAYSAGHSKAHWGESPHNLEPSEAVDLIPSPFKGWRDVDGFRRIKDAMVEARKQLVDEAEIPENYHLEFGIDWGWDYPHTQKKGWNK